MKIPTTEEVLKDANIGPSAIDFITSELRKSRGKLKIYLAGPMSGIKKHNFPAFNKAAHHLRAAGHDVFNPAETDGGDASSSYSYYMRIDIGAILDGCDAVVLLPGWEKSEGARYELLTARMLGLDVYEYNGHKAPFLIEPCSAHIKSCVETATPSPSLKEPFTIDSLWIDRVLINWGDNDTLASSAPSLFTFSMDTSGPGATVGPKQETVLEEAQRLVHGDRGSDYGHPLDDFTKTALIWSGVLHDKLKPGVMIEATDIPPCMVGVKLSRETTKHKRDNCVDGPGYFETLMMVHDEIARRAEEVK